jgi:hypothetical protein
MEWIIIEITIQFLLSFIMTGYDFVLFLSWHLLLVVIMYMATPHGAPPPYSPTLVCSGEGASGCGAPVLSKLFFWQGETKDVRSHSIPTNNILSLLVWWSGPFNHKYWKAHDLQIKDPLVLFLMWRKGWGVEHM